MFSHEMVSAEDLIMAECIRTVAVQPVLGDAPSAPNSSDAETHSASESAHAAANKMLELIDEEGAACYDAFQASAQYWP